MAAAIALPACRLADQEWLDALNLARRKDQLDPVSYEVFEIIIDRLEKEWFDLVRCVRRPLLARRAGIPHTSHHVCPFSR